MRKFYEEHRERIDNIAFSALVLIFIYLLFTRLFPYVAPFFIGLLIALIMEPLIRLLVIKAKFKRSWAALVCLLLFLAAVGSLGTLIVSNLFKQIASFMDSAPALIDELSRKLDDVNDWLSAWSDMLPASLFVEFPDIKDALVTGLTAFFGDGVKDQSLRLVSNVPDIFLRVIMSLVSAFFIMKDRPLIFKTVATQSPAWLSRNFLQMRRGLKRAVGGYFRAQFILMSIAGTLGIGGLLILGNPYALMLGLIMAVLDFMPMMGSGLLLLPWTAFSLISGNYSLAIGLLILYGVITITRQALEPKILGEQIGVHPLVTLMALYIGFKIFGLFGIIIGPSLVIICKAVYTTDNKYNHNLSSPAEETVIMKRKGADKPCTKPKEGKKR